MRTAVLWVGMFAAMLLFVVAIDFLGDALWWASDHLTKTQLALIFAVVFATVLTITFRDTLRKTK